MPVMKIRTVAYWLTTGILAFDFLASGYFAGILWFWKLLGGVALLLPGVPLLKEWAYAGVCFGGASAAVSHAAGGDGSPEVVAPLVFAVLALSSYVLRPECHSADAEGAQHEGVFFSDLA